jgi:hypothetical protein
MMCSVARNILLLLLLLLMIAELEWMWKEGNVLGALRYAKLSGLDPVIPNYGKPGNSPMIHNHVDKGPQLGCTLSQTNPV